MLTAKLEIDKFGNGKTESLRQPARSFVKNFISLLYVAFAQVNYNILDIDGLDRSVKYSPSEYSGRGANLAIVPPGNDRLLVPLECIGIQVGSSDTAVTPIDTDLGDRIHHIDRTPEAANVVTDAFQWSGSISATLLYGASWATAQILVPWAVRLYTCKLRLYRYGTLTGRGPLTVGLRKCDAAGNPVGLDLISGSVDDVTLQGLPDAEPGTLLEVTFDSQYVIRPHTMYALVPRLPNGNSSNRLSWVRSSSSSSQYPYKRGRAQGLTSSDSGASWSTLSYYNQHFFQLLGRRPNGLSYHGTVLRELIKPAVPPPDMQFTIESFFSNYCGSAITVKEVGVYATGSTDREYEGYSFLAARDVLGSPITVAANELLRVRYVVQITV